MDLQMEYNATSVSETFKHMTGKLGALVPEIELKIKAELVVEINRLKEEQDTLILGHNYMEPVLYHMVADIVGDSLELSRQAALANKSTIIFCGVRFMAETAKILNPSKTVLLPAKVAGCSLASSITAADVESLREKFPGTPVVSYINTYADVKAQSDIICTSGNAHAVVESFPNQQVLFLPDKFLAENVAKELDRPFVFSDQETASIPANAVIGWRGVCEVHEQFSVDDIVSIKKQYKDVAVLAHPECSPEVVAHSDISQSTSKMVSYVESSKAPHFLLLTECSMADNIIANNPTKDVLRMCSIRCQHMNEITLEDTLHALRTGEQNIEVPADIANNARSALRKMLEIR